MKKAYHDYFYIQTELALKLYSRADASFLIDSSNFYIERQRSENLKRDPMAQEVLELFGNTSVEIDGFIHECMVEYFQNGVSDSLLNILNPRLQGIRNQLLVESVDGKLVRVYIAYLPINSSPKIFAANMFANITFLGGLDRLKRCQISDCQKFYIGRQNQRWCSDTCGSRSRVREKRKKSKCGMSDTAYMYE